MSHGGPIFQKYYACKMRSNGPFAAERSRGTKSPNWRANDARGHVKQGKFKFGGFV